MGYHPEKSRFPGSFKGPSQRRAAALPSEPLMGRWSTPTTGALSKATPRAGRWRFLWSSTAMLSDPGKVGTRAPKLDRFRFVRPAELGQRYMMKLIITSVLIRTAPHSSALLRTAPHSSAQLRTAPHCSAQLRTAPLMCSTIYIGAHGISSRGKLLFPAVPRDLPSAAQRRYRASPSRVPGRHPPPVPCRRRPPAPPGGASCGARLRCSATQEKWGRGARNWTVSDSCVLRNLAKST